VLVDAGTGAVFADTDRTTGQLAMQIVEEAGPIRRRPEIPTRIAVKRDDVGNEVERVVRSDAGGGSAGTGWIKLFDQFVEFRDQLPGGWRIIPRGLGCSSLNRPQQTIAG